MTGRGRKLATTKHLMRARCRRCRVVTRHRLRVTTQIGDVAEDSTMAFARIARSPWVAFQLESPSSLQVASVARVPPGAGYAPACSRLRSYASRSPLGQIPERTIIGAMSTTRLTREETVERLTASEAEIRALGVQRLALFGSVLRGEARPDSDIDLLVQFSPGAKTFDHFLALFDLLEARLGHRVELVTTEALSPFIGPRILAEAQDVLRAA